MYLNTPTIDGLRNGTFFFKLCSAIHVYVQDRASCGPHLIGCEYGRH